MGENSGVVLSHLRTKFHFFRDASYFSKPLPGCLHQVSFRSYSPLSLELFSRRKPNKCKSFSPQLLGGMIPTFLLRRILSAIYCSPFGKSLVEFRLLISVCEAWLWNGMRNLCRWLKMQVQFEAVCRPKFMSFWDDVDCRTPLVVVNALTDCLHHVSIQRCKPLKSPLSCERRRIFGGWVKMQILFLSIVDHSFVSFPDNIGDPSSCQRTYRLSISCFIPSR